MEVGIWAWTPRVNGEKRSIQVLWWLVVDLADDKMYQSSPEEYALSHRKPEQHVMHSIFVNTSNWQSATQQHRVMPTANVYKTAVRSQSDFWWMHTQPRARQRLKPTTAVQGRSDGGVYRYIYPPKLVYLRNFYMVFLLMWPRTDAISCHSAPQLKFILPKWNSWLRPC